MEKVKSKQATQDDSGYRVKRQSLLLDYEDGCFTDDESKKNSLRKKYREKSLDIYNLPTKDSTYKIRNLKSRSASSNELNVRNKEKKKILGLEIRSSSGKQLNRKPKVAPTQIINPILRTTLKKLDRSSSLSFRNREISSRLLQKEDEGFKMLKSKKNSLDAIKFRKVKPEKFEKELRRVNSEPFLNSWEYANLYADFIIPGRGHVLDILQKKFNKKPKRTRRRKNTTIEVPEGLVPNIKDLNEQFKDMEADQKDVIYEQINEQEILIMAGTKEKLFSLLADHRSPDKEYIDIFLATHLKFMSTNELFTSLLAYFENPLNENAKKKITEEDLKNYQNLIKFRIVNVFKKWLNYHYAYEFEDKTIQTKMAKWINGLKGEQTLYIYMHNAWEKRLQTNYEAYEIEDEVPKSIIPKKQLVDDLGFLDIDPSEMARQITLLNQQMLINVRNNHLLEFLSNPKDPGNPVVEISEYSRTMTAWVTTEILTTPQIKKRTLVLSNFIRLCHCLLGLNNFHGAMDIYLGITHFLVNRLKKTRKAMSSSAKEKLKHLNQIFAVDGGWRSLRGTIKNSTAPLIVPVAIWLHDLIVIDENDDHWESEVHHHKLVNFHKLRLFAAVFKEVYKCQLEPYNFNKIPIIETFLTRHLVALNPEELEKESMTIDRNESKPKSKDKIVRKQSFSNMIRMTISPKK